MPTIIVLVIGSTTILVVLLLVIVVIGIRTEPPSEELTERAQSLVAMFVRRLLGLNVRKPYSSPSADRGDRQSLPTRRAGA